GEAGSGGGAVGRHITAPSVRSRYRTESAVERAGVRRISAAVHLNTPESTKEEPMASIATSTHLPVLDEPHEHQAVGHILETTLQELVDLSLIGKQLHWAVVGPLFRPLHLHLDELVDSWRDLADAVAERAVALGFVPDGQ